MADESDNPILNTALAMMDAAVPGMFGDNPEQAWRDFVPRLRYVVIARTEKPTVDQLKAVMCFSSSFYKFPGRNLIEIRKALAEGEIRLEPILDEHAARNQKLLASAGLHVTLAPLTDAEQAERLAILNAPG